MNSTNSSPDWRGWKASWRRSTRNSSARLLMRFGVRCAATSEWCFRTAIRIAPWIVKTKETQTGPGASDGEGREGLAALPPVNQEEAG